MRYAKAQDCWRDLYKRKYEYTPIEITIAGIIGIDPTSITFPNGICAICGPNGSGKTTLLHAIYNAISDNKNFTQNNRNKNFEYITKCTFNGNEYLYSNTTGDDRQIEDIAIFINIPDQALQTFTLSSNADYQSELEGIDPFIFPSESVTAISQIIGKDYTSIEQYEVTTENNTSIPYFHATTDDLNYFTENMGLGELSVIITIFKIHEASRGKVLLIEEPENFLSPKSQQIFIDHLAFIAASKGIYIILTTHSPYILRKIDDLNIKILNSSNRTTKITSCLKPNEALYSLGLRKNKIGIIFVEDNAAKDFIIAAHRKFYSISKIDRMDIVIKNGWAKIVVILKELPSEDHTLSFIGAIDGDQKENQQCKRNDIIFLPTNSPPDSLIKDLSKTSDFSNKLSTALLISPEVISRAIHDNEATNFHDWPQSVADQLAITVNKLRESIFGLWFDAEPDNSDQTRQFIEQLNNLIRSPQ